MFGAIIGDIIGSPHEFEGTKTKDFPLLTDRSEPTDDSYLTIAVAKCLLDNEDFVPAFHAMVERYPGAGWGGRFAVWARTRSREPYNSLGNGSAMRVGPVGFAFDSEPDVLREAERSAAVTHNHPEGIKGAQATALAVFLARQEADKPEIRRRVAAFSGYDLSRSPDEIRPHYTFNELCQTTVPEALSAFLHSTSFEDAIRNAISLGGDADTLAAIAGPIAQAHYRGVPAHLRDAARLRLPADLWRVIERFENRFGAF